MSKYKNSIIVCLLIMLSFSWIGSAYFTWYYRLLDLGVADDTADMVTDVYGNILQAMGVGIAYFLYRRMKPGAFRAYSFPLAVTLSLILTIASVIPDDRNAAISFGLAMNVMFGGVFAIYLLRLAKDVPDGQRAIVFGIGYGLGSVFTWLLSLINDGDFLRNSYVLIVYSILAAMSIFVYNMRVYAASSAPSRAYRVITQQLLIISSLTILLLSLSKNMGGAFQTSDLSELGNIIEYSRLFYAVGLIAAGLISDRSRKVGSLCCAVALFAPFIQILFRYIDGANVGIWILGYLLFGFFTVFRVVLFTDISRTSPDLSGLAVMGMLFGRLGDAAGTCLVIQYGDDIKTQAVLTSVSFVFTLALFMIFWQRMYFSTPDKAPDHNLQIEEFSSEYSLSSREVAVFRLLLERRSTGEISSGLNISESTVKFHVKNILKKTECTNRQDLVRKFYR